MLFATGLVTLAAAGSANAWGNAVIKNECSFPVYMWAVDAQRNSPNIIQAKDSYSETYQVPSAGGVSLKLSTTNSDTAVTQFEYTLNLTDSKIWYDGSHVDCDGSTCPFYAYGLDLSTSDTTCPTRDCPINQVCTGFYNVYFK